MASNSENAERKPTAPQGQHYERSWAVEWEDLKAFSKGVATGFMRCRFARRWWSQILGRAEHKFCSNTYWPQDKPVAWKESWRKGGEAEVAIEKVMWRNLKVHITRWLIISLGTQHPKYCLAGRKKRYQWHWLTLKRSQESKGMFSRRRTKDRENTDWRKT